VPLRRAGLRRIRHPRREPLQGLRAPHKVKAAVSGCIRECAEAQSKDFGIIATEKGWNLYVCGNGGAKPRHAELLAADIDDETCIKYIDRFLMYYTQTADRLTRTSVWMEKMEGGIEYLKNVIIHDSLGICADLERMMQNVVDTYHCEWAEVVNDPEKRRLFQQFVNTGETEPTIEFVKEREQKQPAAWGSSFVPSSDITLRKGEGEKGRKGADIAPERERWIQVGKTWDFPRDGGAAVKYGKTQIAVFNFESRGEWYAAQNLCPHKREFVLSRGLLGDAGDKPKVACPVHKKTFSLETGKGMSDKEFSIQTFPVKVEGDDVYLLLPSIESLDEVFATDKTCNGSCHHTESAKPKKLPTRKAKAGDALVAAADERV
jgi:nitrite reductase (NADH) large subunit